VGIVGAGKIGTAIARAAIAGGYDVAISGSGTADRIKIVVDAMNYWEEIDGVDEELATAPCGTSVVVQDRFQSSRVVKSLNHLGYFKFEQGRRQPGAPDRLALAAAGNDPDAVAAVLQLIDRLGFDPVEVGSLNAGVALQPNGPAFGIAHSADQLLNLPWPEASCD
jgi:8-hydroxy-5-deazaflavin:NADPH oxidoreductase